MKAGALAAAVLGLAALALPGPAEQAREAATDALMRALPRAETPEGSPAVAVAVTAEDLDALGPWPWPRGRIAALVAGVAEAGAAVIALDIAFPEPAAGDAALSAALAAAPAVLGLLAGAAAAPAGGFGVATLGTPVLGGLMALPGVTGTAVGGAPGALAVLPGEVMRAVPLLARIGPGEAAEGVLPGLALAAVARALGAGTLLLREGVVQVGPFGLPLPEDGLLRLHPAARGVPVVPAVDVLGGALPEGALRGRLALLGATAPEVAPLRPSVLGPFTPSLLVHAEAVSQIAAGWVPLRAPRGVEAGAALLLGLLAAAAVRWRMAGGLGVAGVLAVGWVGGAGAALALGPLLLDPALPAAAALLGGGVEALASALRLARERRELLARFSHRVPRGVIDALLALPAAERLKPERMHVALVMTDLAGFSALTQRVEPAALLALLNRYLSGIEAAAVAEGGAVERLTGDGVLAVFGAPIPATDPEARAVRAARAIDRFGEAFRARPEAVAMGWGETRLGVTAGEVMAGEVGGSRLTWTVYGDAVNLSARLQEFGKVLGVRVLVAGIDDPSLPVLGRHVLRGRDGEVELRGLT